MQNVIGAAINQRPGVGIRHVQVWISAVAATGAPGLVPMTCDHAALSHSLGRDAIGA